MIANTPALQKVPKTTSTADIIDTVRRDGGIILEGYLSPDQVARLNEDIDHKIDSLRPGSANADEFSKDFHGAQTKRLTNLVTLSKTFREDILNDPKTHDISKEMFLEHAGAYWMTTAQVIEIGPGNKAQPLHRDLENVFPFVGMGPSGVEIIINFLIALTDFTEENGATRVIPGSHTWTDFHDRGKDENTVPALMKAGDALFISGKVVHGGGCNKSKDEQRRAVAFAFTPSYFTPEEAYPFMVEMDVVKSMTPFAQTLIGFQSQYPKGCPGLWQSDYKNISDLLSLQTYHESITT